MMQGPPYNGYDYIKIPDPPAPGTNPINATYGIGAYPTVILIKPNRAIAEQDIWPISNTILRSKIIQHGGIPKDCNATTFALTLNSVPTEGGTVSGEGDYEPGAQVDINATPNTGWSFVNWTDDGGTIVSTEPAFTFTMPDNDLTLNANFEMIDYDLTLLVSPEESGEVTGAGTYKFGDPVEVTAIANVGWGFVNWTDDDGNEISTQTAFSFMMEAGDLTLIANFEPVSGVANPGLPKLLSAHPNPASNLVRINSDSKLVGNSYLLYNHLGDIVSAGVLSSESTEIDLSGLPAGVYLFNIATVPNLSIRIIKR